MTQVNGVRGATGNCTEAGWRLHSERVALAGFQLIV